MRIQPVFNRLNNKNNMSKLQTQFKHKNTPIAANRTPHTYTGVASIDLAYASMFDKAIARDLKKMGLI